MVADTQRLLQTITLHDQSGVLSGLAAARDLL
jgi:hypothetical protein